MKIESIKLQNPECILVVDDDKDARTTLHDMLEVMGFLCEAAAEASTALERIHHGGIDLILTDMHMPGLSGLDLIEEVRRYDDSIPVILITGYPSLDMAVESMKRGAVDFIPKPFDFTLISHLIRKALQERRLRQENQRLQADANKAAVIEKLNRELNAKLEELTRLYSISEAFTEFMDSNQVFEHILQVASRVTGAQRASVMMLDRARRHLRIRSALDLPESVIRDTRIRIGEGIAGKVVQSGCISRAVRRRGEMENRDLIHGDFQPEGSWLSLPLYIGDQIFGVVNLSQKVGQADFTPHDEQIMQILLEKAGTKLENQALYEGIYANLIDTLNSLVTTIEAKDPYTREHSLRVTDYALRIAEVLGVGDEDLEMIDFAGTLHDIGKIGVRDEILTKAGRLTDEEFGAIKQHPQIGERIVEPLGLGEIERSIIRNHHERYDGRGYPDGLGGEDIPFLARVVAVADAFDAMTTTRSYRNALSVETAVEELIKNKGTQFDPQVVEAALSAIESGAIAVRSEPLPALEKSA